MTAIQTPTNRNTYRPLLLLSNFATIVLAMFCWIFFEERNGIHGPLLCSSLTGFSVSCIFWTGFFIRETVKFQPCQDSINDVRSQINLYLVITLVIVMYLMLMTSFRPSHTKLFFILAPACSIQLLCCAILSTTQFFNTRLLAHQKLIAP